ncbi:MAG: peptidoglycan DD-metalloendopeptidase family protein [Alphaproteobacteria bacterium]|nr:peptidoglycan DD-metalloendopeptidase family protein [Alphaproteobacteria bacterium]
MDKAQIYPKSFLTSLLSKSWNRARSVLINAGLTDRGPAAGQKKARFSALSVFTAPYRVLELILKRFVIPFIDKLPVHRLFRLRERYLLTKSNKLRLRYVSASLLCGAAALMAVFALPTEPVTMDWPQSDVVASSDDISDEETYRTLTGQVSRGMRLASEAIKKPLFPMRETLEIGTGDTMSGVLEAAGLSGSEAYKVVQALSEHYDPRTVKPGQEIEVNYKSEGEDERSFKSLVMKVDPVKSVLVEKTDDETFTSELQEKELVKREYAYSTDIETSLYGSAARAGIPPQIIAEMIRIYSWNVDFQRDIRSGDKIEVLYEVQETEDGDYARYGEVLYANLSVGGTPVPIYRYEMKDGRVDYFQPDGFSVRKTLMKTPVDGARLSSGFGMRKHPVLGYNKMHKGLDFAAPTGTPIYAAGDGVVEYAGRFSSYGNYVRIRHNSKLKTAYAHMHKFASGVSVGKRVNQGDVIGYIGTTGRSTGPHLHYEVHVNNSQVNPRSVDLPTGEQLTGEEKKKFEGVMASLNQQYAALSKGLKFAGGLH